ncbi:hypothetical protein [Vibrio rumoiensis]|nr:hypothetical protein [Vibrio rumoiensis]
MKHKLIFVLDGHVSARVGKEEYVISSHDAFWLPLDCLTATTYFPNTHVLEVEISARSRSRYSYQAGYCAISPLTLALLQQLALQPFNPENNQQSTWLKALNFELETLKPQINTGENTLEKACKQSPNAMSFQMVINVREALKARSSGAKREKVIADFFNGSESNANELCLAIANTPLS